MSRGARSIQLDLNTPTFQESWFSLESSDAERVRSAFARIRKLSWPEFYKANGFKWEKVLCISPPTGVDALYTFMVADSIRGVAYRDENFMRVMYIQPDHDATYGKK